MQTTPTSSGVYGHEPCEDRTSVWWTLRRPVSCRRREFPFLFRRVDTNLRKYKGGVRLVGQRGKVRGYNVIVPCCVMDTDVQKRRTQTSLANPGYTGPVWTMTTSSDVLSLLCTRGSMKTSTEDSLRKPGESNSCRQRQPPRPRYRH